MSIDSGAVNSEAGASPSAVVNLVTGLFKGYIFGRAAKKQRAYEKAQRAYALAQAQRNLDQFNEDAPRQTAAANQGFSARGLGQSSIQQEGMKYLADTQARESASLQEQLNLARLGKSAGDSMARANRIWGVFGEIDMSVKAAAEIAGAGMGAAGVGGMGGSAGGEVDTSGGMGGAMQGMQMAGAMTGNNNQGMLNSNLYQGMSY